MQWYVLHTKPQKENLVYEQLRLRNIEAYYPTLRVKPVNPRARKIRAYFPGYIFVQVDLKKTGTSNLRWIPGVNRLVTYGSEPACVPDAFIQTIRNKINGMRIAKEEARAFKPGDQVEINSGPFAGYQALFDTRLSGNERVRVLLQMVQDRQVCLEISGEQIEKIH